MTKTLDEKVKQWFVDRNLHKANPVKQFAKLMEGQIGLIRHRDGVTFFVELPLSGQMSLL